MLNNKFFQLSFFLILGLYFILPGYLSLLSVSITKVMLLFLFLLGAIYFFFIGKSKFYLTQQDYLFIFFIFFMTISSILSDAYNGVELRGIANALGLLSIYFFIKVFTKKTKDLFKFISIFFGCLLLLNYLIILAEMLAGIQLSALLHSYLGGDLGRLSFLVSEKIRSGEIRYQGLLVHPLILAALGSYVLFAFSDKSRFSVIVRVVISIVAIHSILLSGSRAGLLTIALYPFLLNFNVKRKELYFLAIAIVFLLLIIFFQSQSIDLYVTIFEGNNYQSQNSTENRLSQLEESYYLFNNSEYMLLLGYGSESSAELMKYGTMDNLWLTILLEVGLIGFVIFILINVLALIKTYKSENKVLFVIFLIFQLYILVISLFHFYIMYIIIYSLVVSKDESITNP
jgi:hypothetical protein